MDAQLLRRLFPNADQANVDSFANQSVAVLPEFGISDARNRLHFFLAQIGHESGGLKAREENMNYSAKRMVAVWPSRFPTIGSAAPFAQNPEALANKVYGGRMGNDQPGDGFRYRGRGYIQITGKDGYRQVGSRIGLDLVTHPQLAIDPEQCLRVACGFWRWKDINPKCDEGDFVAVTKRINGGTVGLEDRRDWLRKVQEIVPWPLPGIQPQPPVIPQIDPVPGTPPFPRELKEGDTGEDVRAMQARLNQHLRGAGRPEIPLGPSRFGPKTKEAVIFFKAARNLGTRPIVDEPTWNSLWR